MGLRVTTYNILADSYVDPSRYPNSSPSTLDPDTRRRILLQRFDHLAPDILCLQEVESGTFVAIESHLERHGFAGCFLNKGHGRPDGCATFYQTSQLDLVNVRELQYSDTGEDSRSSGHVALTLELRQGEYPITVCNTHLRWSPPGTPLEEQWACRQLRELLEHHAGDVPTLVCGDFNFTPEHPLAAELAHRDLRCAFEHDNPATFNSHGTPRKLDYLLHNSQLVVEPEKVPPLCATTSLPSATEPSDHLPLVANVSWA